MKIGRLVNEKVLITFACSMFSLLTLSSVLSHIKIDKNDKKVKASITEVKTKRIVKVDAVDNYSKNQTLTYMPPATPLTTEVKQEQKKEEAKQVVAPPAPKVVGTIADYQAYARSKFEGYGWSDEDFNALVQLWNRESGWNPNSHSRSGAHGIPQALPASKMAAYGSDYLTNYKPQIDWGLNYIKGKYGNPTNAYNNFLNRGWY